MSNSLDFDFVEDESGGGRFIAVGGAIATLRTLLAAGSIDAAVQAYEETDGSARAELLQEAQTASFETKKSIALMFRKARDFASAARVFQLARLENEAALTFEQAGDFAQAAASWVKSHEVVKAAAAYERAGMPAEALKLYRQAGAAERVAECLVRSGHYLEAAKEFRTLKNPHAELETLKSGLSAEPTNLDLVTRMAELLIQHGRRDQAAQLLMETTKTAPGAKQHAPFLRLLAVGLESIGNAAAAAQVRTHLQTLPATAVASAAEPPAAGGPPIATNPAAAAAAASADANAYGFLKNLPMFAELSLADMKSLYRMCTLQQFAAGQHLIQTGQPGRGLFVIVDGQVEVYGGPDANSRLLNTLGVGAYLGEISLVQDGPTSARVTARTAVKALFISRDGFAQYLYGTPAAALRIYRLFTINLADRVRALSAAK